MAGVNHPCRLCKSHKKDCNSCPVKCCKNAWRGCSSCPCKAFPAIHIHVRRFPASQHHKGVGAIHVHVRPNITARFFRFPCAHHHGQGSADLNHASGRCARTGDGKYFRSRQDAIQQCLAADQPSMSGPQNLTKLLQLMSIAAL